MSNYLAIATVTATLSEIVEAAARAAVDNAAVNVTTDRPQANGAQPRGINLFMYQVTPNAALNNADLPTRRGDGSVVQRPCVALDLNYLITFHGNDADLEAQRMMGGVVSALNSRPVLSRERIQSTIDAALTSDPQHYLGGSNLPEQVELVRLTPLPISLEELSKLWSVFIQTPYQLSVTYEASVVLIESDVTLVDALPVAERRLQALPFQPPVIRRIESGTGGQVHVSGGTLVVIGEQFPRDNLSLLIGGTEVAPAVATDSRIEVVLSAATLPQEVFRAGHASVQVLQSADFGTGLRPAFQSNLTGFQFRPTITGGLNSPRVENAVDAGGGIWSANVVMNVAPPLRQGQRVELLLNQSDPSPNAYVFALDPVAADAPAVTVPVSGVATGTYFCRLRVDGADSPLDLAPASPTFGPTVTF